MAPREAEVEAEAESEAIVARGGGGDGRKEENAVNFKLNNKNKNKKVSVCVMEASRALGSALVHTLLLRGYFVHAAFHSKGDIQQLRGQIDSKNLRVFHADLLDYHSILDALTGCSALFYTFEPPLEHSVFDEHMTEIEVRAAHNVLEACAQMDTMEKVIFTSSVTAVIWTESDAACNTSSSSYSLCHIDERNWSDINFCKKFKLWHALSKTLAEKTAWALAMDRGVRMVSVNGGLLLYNNLFTATATTTTSAHNKSIIHPDNLPPYLKGASEMYENGVLVAVDLKFLVAAHICVFEDVSSYGRYLCFNHVINCHEDVAKLATMLMSSHPPPPPQSLEDTRIYPQRISNKKLNKVMVNFDGQFQLD